MKNKDWKEKIAEYLTFSINERWAILVLVMLILILFIAPSYFRDPDGPLIIEDSLVRKAIVAIDSATAEHQQNRNIKIKEYQKKETKGDRFFFDPNTIKIADWIRMGVKEKTALTIAKYRERGGKFRVINDLKKIYGLPPELFEQLKPYVKIASMDSLRAPVNNFHKRKAAANIRINLSDSIEWEALPGIGPTLAGRIINFRKRLGGFYNSSQVAEVYGIQDSVFRMIEPFLENDGQPVELIPVNSASADELAAHPYIRKVIANAIVQYRTVHGRFQLLDDLKKIHLVNQDQFEKISRYCKID